MPNRTLLNQITVSSEAAGVIAWLRRLLRAWLRTPGTRAVDAGRGSKARWYDDTSASRGL